MKTFFVLENPLKPYAINIVRKIWNNKFESRKTDEILDGTFLSNLGKIMISVENSQPTHKLFLVISIK